MSERFIPEHRRTQFKAKNTFKPDELRRRREEQQVEIRKQKREENLAKKRGIASAGNQPGASLGASIDSDDEGGSIESQVCYWKYFPAPGTMFSRVPRSGGVQCPSDCTTQVSWPAPSLSRTLMISTFRRQHADDSS